jgi:hypothetical protein
MRRMTSSSDWKLKSADYKARRQDLPERESRPARTMANGEDGGHDGVSARDVV